MHFMGIDHYENMSSSEDDDHFLICCLTMSLIIICSRLDFSLFLMKPYIAVLEERTWYLIERVSICLVSSSSSISQ